MVKIMRHHKMWQLNVRSSRIRLHFWPFHFDSFLFDSFPSFKQSICSISKLFEPPLYFVKEKKIQKSFVCVCVCVGVWPNFSVSIFFLSLSLDQFRKRASNSQPHAHWINSQTVSDHAFLRHHNQISAIFHFSMPFLARSTNQTSRTVFGYPL